MFGKIVSSETKSGQSVYKQRMTTFMWSIQNHPNPRGFLEILSSVCDPLQAELLEINTEGLLKPPTSTAFASWSDRSWSLRGALAIHFSSEGLPPAKIFVRTENIYSASDAYFMTEQLGEDGRSQNLMDTITGHLGKALKSPEQTVSRDKGPHEDDDHHSVLQSRRTTIRSGAKVSGH